MKLWLQALAAAGALTVANSAFASILWQSDFIRKGIDQFNIYDVGPQISDELAQSSGPSKWYVQNGALNQDSNIYGTPDPADGTINEWTGTQAVVKDFSAQDGIFFIQFTTADDDGIGIVFRYQDQKNFMRFFSLRDPGNGGPATRLEKWTDGKMEILQMTQDSDQVYQQNVPETMMVIAKGGDIKAYVAGLDTPLLEATDADPKPGSMGVALYAMSKSNNIPLSIYNIEALTPDSNLYLANLKNKSGDALGNYWTTLSQNGKSVGGIFTNPQGQALFLDVPAGDYDLALGGLTVNTVSQKASVKAGVTAGTFTIDPARNDQVADLTSGQAATWKVKVPTSSTDDFSDPAASESGFVAYNAPSDDWDSVDANNGAWGWLRGSVTIPAAYQGKDLALTGYSFTGDSWIYWNGKLIGYAASGATPVMAIPGALVKASDTLAIRAYKTTGSAGFITAAPMLYAANPSVTLSGVAKDASGNALSGVLVSAGGSDTLWGVQSASTVTGADGGYVITGLAPGTYDIQRTALGTADTANVQTVTQTGAAGQTITANFTTAPVYSLASENGLSWLLDYGTNAGDDFSATTAKETDFSGIIVPGTLETQNEGVDYNLYWYRVHFKLPASFASYKGQDLILTNFNVDDADVSYVNGTKVGSDGTLPTDPADPTNTGYVSMSGDVRAYTIPASLVSWDGDNVLAIQGYENSGDSGITAGFPAITVVGATAPAVTLGDLNADGKINVSDATISLRIAVGLVTPTADQKTAGDVNKDGKLSVSDTTLILQVAVGLKTGF